MEDSKPKIFPLKRGRSGGQDVLRLLKAASKKMLETGKDINELCFISYINCKNCGKITWYIFFMGEKVPEVCCEKKV